MQILSQRSLFLLLLLTFWWVSLNHIEQYPPVSEDEPWIAAPAHNLAVEGIYGTSLFADYYGMDTHYYQHMPLYPILQAGLFRLTGLGVLQMRLLSVSMGLLILALMMAIGKQIGGSHIGLMAIYLAIFWRVFALPAGIGIPLFDYGRIGRYDIGVPLWGLSAIWLFDQHATKTNPKRMGLIGILIGFATLSHLYGLFFLPVIFLMGLQNHTHKVRSSCWLLGGLACICSLWLLYALTGWADYVGQMRYQSNLFDLTNWRFYLSNVLNEYKRYPLNLFVDGGIRWRVGFALLVALPLGIWQMLRQNRRSHTWTIALTLIFFLLCYTLLLSTKNDNYMIAIWPLVCLVVAWCILQFPRWVWAVAAVLICVDGALAIDRFHTQAALAQPYTQHIEQLEAHLSADTHILGLQTYWLGLNKYDYRSWLVPLLKTNPQMMDTTATLKSTLSAVNPDTILVGKGMGPYLRNLSHPSHEDHQFWLDWLAFSAENQIELTAVIASNTYGDVCVYQRAPATVSTQPCPWLSDGAP